MRLKLYRGCLLVFGLLICLPIFAVILGAFKSTRELTEALSPIIGTSGGSVHWRLFPFYPTGMHFVKLLFYTPEFFTVFWNSMKLVGCILLGQMFVAVPAAFGFSRFSFRGKHALFLSYVILMLMPFGVMMLPSYLVLKGMHLMNTHWAIILPAVFSAFPVFLMYRGFEAIPKELYEAAKIDGAGDWQMFFWIGIPLGSPGILSALVLGFLEYWNMVEQPLAFLEDLSLWPLSLYLPEIDLSRAGMALAASVITLIPAVFVFFMGQDYLESGIAASGMKE
ncbi:MAG: carbohydrate ABC transporter permease [Eubacterium sp.]|nr:carbohydrate ABC transporter permease [Eubacterium sp.]MCI9210654.1 carbohydrate ABC transporter permease [Eubacterium sp.]